MEQQKKLARMTERPTEQQLANISGETADGTAKKLARMTERPTEQQLANI